MQEGTIGRRYARALASSLAGADEARLQKVEDELSATAALLDRSEAQTNVAARDFRQAMLNPSFSAEQRSKVLSGIAKKHAFDDTTASLLALLVEKDRIPQLPAIARAFRDEVDAKVGRVRATIVTAKPLDPKDLLEIVRGLEKRTGKKVVPEVEVDPSVLAGVRARIGGLVFDATVRAQLDRLRANFLVN